ncbi:MAG: hypothetical protein FJX78_02840 [Armatimonadetes bacterium]|nr:hypothetical protein [Armatimonadota bacterium]
MMATALTLAFLLSAGTAWLANAGRLGNGRVWLAFVVGAVVAFFVSLVSRPFVQIAGQLGGWESESVFLYVISSSVHGFIAELFKITAALLLLSSTRTAFGHGEGLGAAIGAGAALNPIAQFLEGALMIASLGLPGGQSLPQGVGTAVSLVLLSAATTGLGTGISARGQLLGGIALTLALTLGMDPGLRLVADGTAAVIARVAFAVALFGWLLWRGSRAGEGEPVDAPILSVAAAEASDGEPEPTGSRV